MNPKKDEVYEVDLITLVYGGDAMGRLPDGRAVFVPYALPGERVRVRLTEQKRGFARAELLEVIRSSADRVAVDETGIAACGGCHYIHMTYPAQLRAKTDILRDQFRRIAGIEDPPVEPIIPSPQEWHYRNAVQFHLTPDARLGFQLPGTNKVIPMDDCLLCEPAIQEILPQLEFDADTGLERVQVRAGSDGEIMIVLESANPVPPDFSVDLPVSAVFVGPGGFEENQPLILAGDDHLVMEAAGRAFRVSAGSFFQVNTAQAENMISYLRENLPLNPGTNLLEIYSGVGLFSAFLAPRVARLAAVESAPSAVEDFAINLNEFENVDVYEGLAEEILPSLEFAPDLVMVDPPRSGLGIPVMDALAAMQPPFIAYISCDPSTLARDAKRLLAAGYTLTRSQPFDMFPQTYHIESINFFNKV